MELGEIEVVGAQGGTGQADAEQAGIALEGDRSDEAGTQPEDAGTGQCREEISGLLVRCG